MSRTKSLSISLRQSCRHEGVNGLSMITLSRNSIGGGGGGTVCLNLNTFCMLYHLNRVVKLNVLDLGVTKSFWRQL